MQYIWQHRLWPGGSIRACAGERIEVLSPGALNRGSGPDFFDARILVDRLLWAGTVEMHVQASDWHRHGHDHDPAYENVVLHVVSRDDDRISVGNPPRVLPQIILSCPENFMDTVNKMLENPATEHPCAVELDQLDSLTVTDWLTMMGMERLHRKGADVAKLLTSCHGDWQETVYITLARGLGMGVNADAMERLARATPLHILLKYSNDPGMAVALLTGRAGLLRACPESPEDAKLVEEYRFYSAMFRDILPPFQTPVWQTKVRPANQPRRRIAQLARLIADEGGIVGRILGLRTIDRLKSMRGFFPEWVGPQAATSLCINVVAPCIYAYGQAIGDSVRRETATSVLYLSRAEKNSIISSFPPQLQRFNTDAFTSQALIQLHKNYCQLRRCLQCRFGHKILASKVQNPSINRPL